MTTRLKKRKRRRWLFSSASCRHSNSAPGSTNCSEQGKQQSGYKKGVIVRPLQAKKSGEVFLPEYLIRRYGDTETSSLSRWPGAIVGRAGDQFHRASRQRSFLDPHPGISFFRLPPETAETGLSKMSVRHPRKKSQQLTSKNPAIISPYSFWRLLPLITVTYTL